MSISFLGALAGTLAALAGAGLLIRLCTRALRVDLVAWVVALAGLAVALAAQAAGYHGGFGPTTFRATQLGAALVAPLALCWGMIEMVARGQVARFATRLCLGGLFVVAAVILATDVLSTQPFSQAWPAARMHYEVLPLGLLALIAVVVLGSVVGTLATAGLRAARDPRWRPALPAAGAAAVGAVATQGLLVHLPVNSGYVALCLVAVVAAGLAGDRAARTPRAVLRHGRDAAGPPGYGAGQGWGADGAGQGWGADGARPRGYAGDDSLELYAGGQAGYGGTGGFMPTGGYGDTGGFGVPGGGYDGYPDTGSFAGYPAAGYTGPSAAMPEPVTGAFDRSAVLPPEPVTGAFDRSAVLPPEPVTGAFDRSAVLPPEPVTGAFDRSAVLPPEPVTGAFDRSAVLPPEPVTGAFDALYRDSGPPRRNAAAAGMPASGAREAGIEFATGMQMAALEEAVLAQAGPGRAGPVQAGPGGAGRGGAGTARPAAGDSDVDVDTDRLYGQIAIYTLLEAGAAEFDRLSGDVLTKVRTGEPNTLVYVVHAVPSAPLQRILYQVYRDRQAYDEHLRQPYVADFDARLRPLVLATNVIELGVREAKVAALRARSASRGRA